ncbi:unnamed protein product, partial [marine sediment metagenome]
ADVLLPNFDLRDFGDIREAIGRLIEYLRVLNQALVDRDIELKSKVNQLHVEYVTAEPSDAPDEPEPVFRIYNNAGTHHLYIYISGENLTGIFDVH